MGARMTQPERRLWRAYRSRRTIAGRNALVEHYYPILPLLIGRVCPSKFGERVSDEDVSAAGAALITAVECYRDAYRAGHRASFTTFLCYGLKHVVIAERQKMAIRSGSENDADDVEDIPGSDGKSASGARREVMIAGRELAFFVAMLPRKQASVIRLRYDEGMTRPQIMRRLRMSGRSVDRIHSHAIATLRRYLRQTTRGGA
jgi:DNA-directed RNA polymerase specialized sigma subunit